MKKVISFIVIILVASQAIAWDCKTKTKRELYEENEIIFIGKVIQGDSSSYRVIVQELFKGSLPDTVVGKLWDETYGSSIRPEWGETWLIYGDVAYGVLISDVCSGSRSFKFPYGYHSNAYPTPPPRQLKEVDTVLLRNIDHAKGLNELYADIITLRQWNLEEEIKLMKIEDKDYTDRFNLIFGIQAVILILLILLMFKKR